MATRLVADHVSVSKKLRDHMHHGSYKARNAEDGDECAWNWHQHLRLCLCSRNKYVNHIVYPLAYFHILYIHRHSCMHTYIQTHTYAQVHVLQRDNFSMHERMCIHIHACIHARMHTYVHAYAHVRVLPQENSPLHA